MSPGSHVGDGESRAGKSTISGRSATTFSKSGEEPCGEGACAGEACAEGTCAEEVCAEAVALIDGDWGFGFEELNESILGSCGPDGLSPCLLELGAVLRPEDLLGSCGPSPQSNTNSPGRAVLDPEDFRRSDLSRSLDRDGLFPEEDMLCKCCLCWYGNTGPLLQDLEIEKTGQRFYSLHLECYYLFMRRKVLAAALHCACQRLSRYLGAACMLP